MILEILRHFCEKQNHRLMIDFVKTNNLFYQKHFQTIFFYCCQTKLIIYPYFYVRKPFLFSFPLVPSKTPLLLGRSVRGEEQFRGSKMGTSVQVTPLCGVYNENPLSYLVSIDGFNFLVDCGWNDHFDPSLLQPLARSLSLSVCLSLSLAF